MLSQYFWLGYIYPKRLKVFEQPKLQFIQQNLAYAIDAIDEPQPEFSLRCFHIFESTRCAGAHKNSAGA